MTDLTPAAVYRQRSATYGAALAASERRARRNGNLNVVLFFAAAAALMIGAVRNEPAWYWLAALLAGAFVAGLIWLQRNRQAVAYAAALLAASQEGLARLERNWAALPAPPAASRPGALPRGEAGIDAATAADLDLLGPSSLQHLLNTPATPAGETTLRAWLLAPASPAVILARQDAVRELAPLIDFRDALGAHARQMGAAQAHYERFVAWAESAPSLVRQSLLLWAARLLPLLALGLGIAAWYDWPIFAALPLYPLLGGVLLAILALALTAGNRAAATIAQVEAHQEIFSTYASLFHLLEQQPLATPELRRQQSHLGAQTSSSAPPVLGAQTSSSAPPVPGAQTSSSAPPVPGAQTSSSAPPVRASKQMRRLQRLMPFASIRRWMLFLPVELFTLWNVHLLWLLERWQKDAGRDVHNWLDALGEIEALAALASLHHDHPDWCFPTLAAAQNAGDATASAGLLQVQATALAHPLLPPAVAVGNDVTVGPPGSFLLVTGSNMSGKSTLLRALGLNCVLAQMGAPACAASLHLPPLRVASSMRVQDSLSQGVSYFLAELQSLKSVVDCAEGMASPARSARPEDVGFTLFYLLDEILQGTNSAERQIAARHIIQRLVASGAIGAVSTHDLALAAAPELAEAAVPVHFTESFTPATATAGPAMHFDYKLRPGVATSTNALRLMELVGL